VKRVNFARRPKQWREEIDKNGLCYFNLDSDGVEPDEKIRGFLSAVFLDSLSRYSLDSFPLECESSASGDNIVEDTTRDLIAHCDGILMEEPPEWICIYKTSQHNLKGSDVSLLSAGDLIDELVKDGAALSDLLELELPYKFPKYHIKYRDNLESTWISFLKEEERQYIPRYAPDVIQRDLLTSGQRRLLTQIETVILRLQKRNAVDLPIGCGYLVSNKRFLHGRNALSTIDSALPGTRSVHRVRLYT
jgi:hypothetical protein